MEGVGTMIAGALGSGNGTTSYSENIGAIGITKVRLYCFTAKACYELNRIFGVLIAMPKRVMSQHFASGKHYTSCTDVLRRVARNSRWGGMFWGAEPPKLENFAFFYKNNLF